jgi:hypothetical protein
VPYREEPSFESGQMLIDKSRCWEPLAVTMWMNRHSDFWYRYFFGDKDTFHLAWRKLNRGYAMPSHGVDHLQYGMGHRDFDGKYVFKHRNRAKWVLSGWNPQTDDFPQEARGYELLEELRRLWKPDIVQYDLSATERLKSAWKRYCENPASAPQLLSAELTEPKAWRLIGQIVDHIERCIHDAHTVNLIRKALDAAPQAAELHAMMGTTLGAMGRRQKARESFQVAQRLCKDLPGLSENLRLCSSSDAPPTPAGCI